MAAPLPSPTLLNHVVFFLLKSGVTVTGRLCAIHPTLGTITVRTLTGKKSYALAKIVGKVKRFPAC